MQCKIWEASFHLHHTQELILLEDVMVCIVGWGKSALTNSDFYGDIETWELYKSISADMKELFGIE